MIAVHAGNMVVKVDRRFGVAEAIRIRETVDRVAPLREVVIDFGAASVVEDKALLVIAELMKAHPGSRIQLGGLTNHGRRLLRYMGALDPLAIAAREDATPAIHTRRRATTPGHLSPGSLTQVQVDYLQE